MKKKYVFRTENELEGLRWTARVVDFGVSLTIISSLNELTTAYIMLRDRKDVFHHRVKQLANETMQKATNLRTSILSVMKKGDFFDTYSDRVIDLAENDITMFRISIKQTLDDNGVRDADLVSYLETARTMLEMAVAHFDSVMTQATKDYGVNYRKAFCEFNATDVYERWQKVCEMLYQHYDCGCDIDLNTERTTQLFNKVGGMFADGEYVGECLRDAMGEHPEFKNEIEVKEA